VWISSANQICRPASEDPSILRDEHLALACPADSVLTRRSDREVQNTGIRDLDHSTPYMHIASLTTLITQSVLSRFIEQCTGRERCVTAPRVEGIALLPADISPLVVVPQIAERGLQQGDQRSRSNQPVATIHRNGMGALHSAGGGLLFLQRLPALLSEDKRGRTNLDTRWGRLTLFLDLFRR